MRAASSVSLKESQHFKLGHQSAFEAWVKSQAVKYAFHLILIPICQHPKITKHSGTTRSTSPKESWNCNNRISALTSAHDGRILARHIAVSKVNVTFPLFHFNKQQTLH